ncbi:MAG: SHOCT domain-containing protein [Planctomycetota bacterium]
MWQKSSVFLGVIIVTVTQPLLAVAQTPTPDAPRSLRWPHAHEHWHMWGDNPGWHFWWMPLILLLFFVMFLVVMRFFRFDRRWHMAHWPSRDTSSSAIEILKERFARGEIPESEYMDKKARILSENTGHE